MIDKKGRIFGKINIIDLVVVILVLCLAGGLIYNLFWKKDEIATDAGQKSGTATITFEIKGVGSEWVENINEGDKLIIDDTVTDVEVISVGYETSVTTATTAEGEIVAVENPTCVDCEIVVRGSASRDALGVSIMGHLYRVNDSREIRTDICTIIARVDDVQFEPAE